MRSPVADLVKRNPITVLIKFCLYDAHLKAMAMRTGDMMR